MGISLAKKILRCRNSLSISATITSETVKPFSRSTPISQTIFRIASWQSSRLVHGVFHMKQISLICAGAIVGILLAVMFQSPVYATCEHVKGIPHDGVL